MAMTDEEKKLGRLYHEKHAPGRNEHPAEADLLHKVDDHPAWTRARASPCNFVERATIQPHQAVPRVRALAILFGGRTAEEIIFGPENVTTGAASDIQMATQMARGMITAYGMSDKLGRACATRPTSRKIFIGHAVTQTQNVSEATACPDHRPGGSPPDRRGASRSCAQDPRTSAIDELHRSKIAKALLEYETLSKDEIGQILTRREDRSRRYRRRRLGGTDRRRRSSRAAEQHLACTGRRTANPRIRCNRRI